MSEPAGPRPDDAAEGLAAEVRPAPPLTGEQPTPEQPYDVSDGTAEVVGGAQQYGQPPATGYQAPDADPPGAWAPVEGPGPQQYGQPEHGQASYLQEGFPTPSPSGPPAYVPEPGSAAQQGYPPPPGYAPQPSYGTPQPYVPQPPYGAQPGYAPQPPYGAQPGYAPQQPYPGQQPPPYGGPVHPPQPYAGPAPMSDSDQRLWATLTNISVPFFGFVGPLVAWAVLKDRSPFLKDSTTEALNFSITVSIALFVGWLLTALFIGLVLIPVVVGIAALVLAILAAIAANKGEVYRYPLSWRLVK